MTTAPAAQSLATPIGAPPTKDSFLRRYNPLRLFFGPSFAKEMRVTGRKGSTYSYRFGYTLLLLLVIGLAFWSASASLSVGGAASALQQYQAVAPMTAAAIVWIQFVVLAVLAPSLTAGAVADEKLARTLPSLMTTPLPAAEIILGKFSARMVLLLILAAIPTPILLSVRVFGGLSGSYIAYSLAVSLSVFVLGLACGTLMSVRAHRSSSASAGGLGLTVVILMLPVLLVFVLDRADMLSERTSGALMRVFSPMTMASITESALSSEVSPRIVPTILYNLAFAAAALALAVLWCRRVLNRYAAFDAPSPVRQKKERRTAEPERAVAGVSGADPRGAPAEAPAAPAPASAEPKKRGGLRFASTNRDVWNDPLLWRELRQPAFNSRVKLAVTVAAAVLFWLWFALGALHDSLIAIHGFVMFIGLVVFGVQVASRASGAIAQERDARTLDTLLTVPVRPVRIVLAKAVGSLRQQWFVPVFVLLHFGVVGLYTGTAHPVFVLQLTMIYAGTAALLAGVGVLLGLLFKRALAASTLTQGVGMLLWVALPFGHWLLTYLLYPGTQPPRIADRILEVIYLINPFVLLSRAFETGVAELVTSPPGLHQLDYGTLLGYPDIGPVVYTLVVAGVLLLALLVGAASLWLASNRFNRFVGRPS